MNEGDWPVIAAALKGIWPRRELEPARYYLLLLEPYSVADVKAAIVALGARSRYAPTPSELRQALGDPTPAPCPLSAALAKRWALVASELERALEREALALGLLAWLSVIHPHAFEEQAGWTLATAPALLPRAAQRAHALAAAAGAPVALVPCASPGVPR